MLAMKYYYNRHYNPYKAITLIDLFKLQETFKTYLSPYFVPSSDHVPKYILYLQTQSRFVATVHVLLPKIKINAISKLKNTAQFFNFLSPLSKKESCLKNNETNKNQQLISKTTNVCLFKISKLKNEGNINK